MNPKEIEDSLLRLIDEYASMINCDELWDRLMNTPVGDRDDLWKEYHYAREANQIIIAYRFRITKHISDIFDEHIRSEMKYVADRIIEWIITVKRKLQEIMHHEDCHDLSGCPSSGLHPDCKDLLNPFTPLYSNSVDQLLEVRRLLHSGKTSINYDNFHTALDEFNEAAVSFRSLRATTAIHGLLRQHSTSAHKLYREYRGFSEFGDIKDVDYHRIDILFEELMGLVTNMNRRMRTIAKAGQIKEQSE